MNKLFFLILLLLFPCIKSNCQEIYFTLETKEKTFLALPFKVQIDNVNMNRDSIQVNVYRIENKKIVPLTCQLETGYDNNYVWILPDKILPAKSTIKFKIEITKGLNNNNNNNNNNNIVLKDAKNIRIMEGVNPVFNYHSGFMTSPPGINPLYGKSGFIHPLYSPKGNILTRIQPEDHYHHYGIWNPWTKIKIKSREMDLWNLVKGQGTVRYAGLQSTTEGELFCGIRLCQEHVDYGAKGADRVIMNETWSVKNFPVLIDGKKCWLMMFNIQLNNAIDTVIELAKYRYGGGIGYRATEQWTNKNSRVLTSEGKARKDADASHARWCIAEGDFENSDRSGIVFFSHPGNRAHPEPMRVWPENANNGRGDLFFQFCPIRHKSWFIETGKTYVQKYMMVVYDGSMNPETAEQIWQFYAHPPSITFK